MTEKLFYLLCNALWDGNVRVELSYKEFSDILKLAKEQTVFGLVFDVLKDIPFDGMSNKAAIYEAIGQYELVRKQNRLINKELCSFVRKCDKIGLDYLIVKGQTIGSLYPQAELRQPGDIDFLITQLSQIPQMFPDVDIPKKLFEKEYAYSHNDITFELHTRLIDFGCKKHNVLWNSIIAEEWTQFYYVDIDGEKVRTLSPTVNATYLFLHLFFHMIREGVSLRQFCDWAVFLHNYRDAIDNKQLSDIIGELGMINAYKAFGCILVDRLGLPEADFPLTITDSDRQWKKKIVNDVFRGGNFGKKNHKAMHVIGYKLETMRLAIRNSIRYYKLAPSEMRMMIPKMIILNIRLILN